MCYLIAIISKMLPNVCINVKLYSFRHKIGIGQNLKVVSTSKHLLFYDGDGKSQEKFYILKDEEKNH
jgi:hypothetical protein